MNKIT